MSRQSRQAEYAETAAGARRRGGVRVPMVLAVATAVVAGGVFGLSRLRPDDVHGSSADPAGKASAPVSAVGGSLDVSGSGVGEQPFGTDADEILADVSARLGTADVTVGPRRYTRAPGSDKWLEDAGDPLSLSWQYPVVSVTCWAALCLIFGGDDVDELQLRGWELSRHRRWSESGPATDLPRSDVRLAGTGIRLGDSWERLHAAYPDVVVSGAEGSTVAVRNTPWAVVFDGVAGWRLSGPWDYTHPTRAPAGAVVIRLSAGEGPEPGCC